MRLTLLLLAASLCAQAQTLTLNGPPVRVGNQTTLVVTLAGTSGSAASLQWFTPSIAGMTATVASGLATAKNLICQVDAGLFGCVLSGGATTIPDGIVAMITLTPPAGATPLPLTGVLGSNPAGDSPGIAIASGPLFTLNPISPCDVNGDGKTDDKDIIHVRDEIEGVIPPTTDLDGNGKTDVVDLQRVIDAAATNGTCRVGA
jgi:hypothetical protein